ncbi:MAG: dihydrofolate reductase [Oceanobacter sp.]
MTASSPSRPESVTCSLIVALARNHTIGLDNDMPWHLPDDLKYFRQQTSGKPVVMGRKTFESIGRPLPKRTNIVITRQSDFQPDGVVVVNSLEQALEVAREAASKAEDPNLRDVIIMGGAQIYQQALPCVDRLLLTEIQAEIAGDTFFPAFDRSQWQEVSRDVRQPCSKNPLPYDFVVYQRRT